MAKPMSGWCADGRQQGQVDRRDGDSIKLTRNDSGTHRWLPLNMVDRMDEQADLKLGHEQGHQQGPNEAPHSEHHHRAQLDQASWDAIGAYLSPSDLRRASLRDHARTPQSAGYAPEDGPRQLARAQALASGVVDALAPKRKKAAASTTQAREP